MTRLAILVKAPSVSICFAGASLCAKAQDIATAEKKEGDPVSVILENHCEEVKIHASEPVGEVAFFTKTKQQTVRTPVIIRHVIPLTSTPAHIHNSQVNRKFGCLHEGQQAHDLLNNSFQDMCHARDYVMYFSSSLSENAQAGPSR
jgi:hypothetical protein